jgi:small GTP-binding protein
MSKEIPSGIYQIKTVFLGAAGVGKSSIALRFVREDFFPAVEGTIGAAFMTKSVPLNANTTLKFEIWDTAGQERYNSLAPMYYRGAHVGIVVYDITSKPSFERAKKWLDEVMEEEGRNGMVIVLVGNKVDLSTQREIPTEDGKRFADSKGVYFNEVSAKGNVQVTELFAEIARRIPFDKMAGAPIPNLVKPVIREKEESTRKCNCVIM